MERIFFSLMLFTFVDCKFLQKFAQLIETGSYTYVSGTGNAGLTFTFDRAKNTTNYKQVLAYQRLKMQLDNRNHYCYSIYLQTATTDTTSLIFNIRRQCNNNLDSLTVRYLIIDSTLLTSIQFIQIYKYFNSSPLEIPTQYTNKVFYQQSVSLIASQTNTAIILRGVTVKNSDDNLRLIIGYSLTDSQFKIHISRQTQTFRIFLISVTVMLMKKDISVYNTTGNLYYLNRQQTYSNNDQFQYNDATGKFGQDTLFFGINSFKNFGSRKFDFRFRIDSSTKLILNVEENPRGFLNNRLEIQVINFVFLICNSSTNKYFYPVNFTCLSLCPSGYFCNQSQPLLCQICSTSCKACQNRNYRCTSCVDSKYLTNSNTCANCPWQCAICTSLTHCSSCISLHILINSSCVADCSLIPNCNQCNFVSPNVNCTQCTSGYSALGGVCVSVCGDGYINGVEQCDDHNGNDDDGCSSNCLLQQYFTCVSSGTGSICSISQVQAIFSYALKKAKSNSFTAYYFIKPKMAFMHDLNWTQAISYSSSDMIISGSIFDSSAGILRLQCDYNTDLTDLQLYLQINYSALSSLYLGSIPSQNLSHSIEAQNNLALNNYPQAVYNLAVIIQNSSLILSVMCLILLVLGLIIGKLIILEHLAIFQITYLCTVTVHNASPTSGALRSLNLVVGIIQIGNYDYSSNIDRQIKGINFGSSLISSCNIGFILTLILILLSLIVKTLSKVCFKNNKVLQGLWPLILGQITFYSLVFSSYSIFSQLLMGISVIMMGNMSVLPKLALSFLFFILVLVYSYLLFKKPDYFGVFKRKFQKMNICQYFYNFIILQRIISSILIIQLRKLQFGLTAQLLPIGVLIIFIAVQTPYILGGSRRALINLFITSLNVLLFLADNIMGKKSNIFIPFIIIGLLIIVTCTNIFYLYKQLQQICAQIADQKSATIFASILSNMLKYQKVESIEEKNDFQLEYFRQKIIGQTPGLNPIITSKNQTLPTPESRQRFVNEEWQFYATLSTNRNRNRNKNKFKISKLDYDNGQENE